MLIGGKMEIWSVSLHCHPLEVKLCPETHHKYMKLMKKPNTIRSDKFTFTVYNYYFPSDLQKIKETTDIALLRV